MYGNWWGDIKLGLHISEEVEVDLPDQQGELVWFVSEKVVVHVFGLQVELVRFVGTEEVCW